MLMYAMFQKLMEKPSKSRKDSSDSDEDLDGGKVQKAFRNMERLKQRVAKGDRRLVVDFEKEIKAELSIVPGQPWTLVDD